MILFSITTFVIFHFGLGQASITGQLAGVVLAVIGTLVSAIAIQSRARDLIGPIVGLPLLIPALIGTARGAGSVLALHGSTAPPGKWVAIVALYDIVFALVAYAVFDFLL